MNLPALAHAPRTQLPAATLRRTLCLLFLLPALAHAQMPQPTPDDEEVLTVRTDLVTVPLYVTDSHRRRVPGLNATDFQLRSDGRPAAISYFASGATRVALLFALDASGSAREHIARQREAAAALLSRFGPGSRAAVLAFAERPALTLPFTTEAATVRTSFEIDARHNSRTAVFDAALAAVRAFERSDATERRIVLLLSDGLDTASTTRPREVVEAARSRGVSIYVIHFPLFEPRDGALALRPPAKGFRDLAEQTGGTYFLLGDARHALDPRPAYDLAPVFRAVADDLQSQYVLGFYLDEASRQTTEHTVQVTLTTPQRNRLRVHTMRERYTVKP